jgi:hypothetical protein
MVPAQGNKEIPVLTPLLIPYSKEPPFIDVLTVSMLKTVAALTKPEAVPVIKSEVPLNLTAG